MKTTTVPAQITTVEDKIAGNLSMSQIMLMAAPIFLGGLLYIIFPPVMRFTAFKMVLSSFLLVIFFTLAIRIRGKILLTWLIVISRYNFRPRFYLYNKNDTYLRQPDQFNEIENNEEVKQSFNATPSIITPTLAVPERVRIESAIADPRAKLKLLTTRKGGLDVRITEIKQEG